MEIFFYQSECGDAARIRYIGSDSKPHNIFIDSGFERTYKYVLKSEIDSLQNNGEVIDLWIVSHIHDDHIGGILSYTKEVNNQIRADIVRKWYYNPPRLSLSPISITPTFEISKAKSIAQGDSLAEYLLSKNQLPSTDINSNLTSEDFHGLKIKVLSPSTNELKLLRNKYEPSNKDLEQNEVTSISSAKSSDENDYNISFFDFNLKNYQEDISIENGSSISVLTEYQDCKVLWLADAHPMVVAAKLKQLGYSKMKPLVCNWVKMAHHGSKGNNSDQLYELIRCDNYLISANGINKHNLPNKECLVRVLRNSNRLPDAHYRFFFTYDNPTLRSMFNVDGEAIFKELDFSIIYPVGQKYVVARY